MAQLFSVSMKSLFSENNPMCNDSFLIKDYVIQIFILTSCIHFMYTQYFFCFLESKYLLPFLFLTAIFYVCGLLALISRRCKFLSRFIAYLSLIFVTPEFPHILHYFFWLYPWKKPKIMTFIKHVWLGAAWKLNGVKVTWSQKAFFLKRW